MNKNTYWANNGEEQAAYDRLYEALVPGSGACSTVEGELLRAVSKVYYDHYNNGLGNDMRGPVAFLMAHYPQPDFWNFYVTLAQVAPENRSGNGLDEDQFEKFVTSVVRHVDAAQGEYHPLVGGDMWTYRDRIPVVPDEPEESDWDFEMAEED